MPQGRSGRVRKVSPPPGFDPQTVQPVASRYTDCAIPAPVPEYHTFLFSVAYKMPSRFLNAVEKIVQFLSSF